MVALFHDIRNIACAFLNEAGYFIESIVMYNGWIKTIKGRH